MLTVDYTRHAQTINHLFHSAIHSPHPPTRERFLALARIANGQSPVRVADDLGRQPDTVRSWLKLYNHHGPDALTFVQTGGPTSAINAFKSTIEVLIERAEAGKPFPWTLRRLVSYLADEFNIKVCRETVRRCLKSLEYSWKKAKKLLTRADPDKRAAFIERLLPLLQQATRDERVLVFMDPAHIHQDCDLGYGWAKRGERLWAASSSPGLSKRVTFYGIYLYNEGQVRIWPYERANGTITCEVLRRLALEVGSDKPVTLLWDGASYHRAKMVKQEAERLGIEIVPLPGYSPDFMPVEELWRWFRSVVTNSQVHETKKELIEHAAQFESNINQNLYQIADRLVVKTHLDPEEEKLKISS
jgi:transposase